MYIGITNCNSKLSLKAQFEIQLVLQGRRFTNIPLWERGIVACNCYNVTGIKGNTKENPGFLENWKVKWENLHPVFRKFISIEFI